MSVTDTTASPPSSIPVNPPCGAPLTRVENAFFSGALLLKMRDRREKAKAEAEAAAVGQRSESEQCSGPRSFHPSQSGPGCASRVACSCCGAFFSAAPAVALDVSIEGRFLRPTTGCVWMGAELGAAVPFTLSLSWLKRGVISVVANLISSFIPHVKWTLGSAAKGEYPLIAFPLVKAMDRLHSTPLDASAAAPTVGWRSLPSSPPELARSALSVQYRFLPSLLYSFSFYSANLDLLQWRATHLPGLPDLDLHGLWKEHPLRLVCYELIDERGAHSPDNRRTFFSVQIEHTGKENHHAAQQQPHEPHSDTLDGEPPEGASEHDEDEEEEEEQPLQEEMKVDQSPRKESG